MNVATNAVSGLLDAYPAHRDGKVLGDRPQVYEADEGWYIAFRDGNTLYHNKGTGWMLEMLPDGWFDSFEEAETTLKEINPNNESY